MSGLTPRGKGAQGGWRGEQSPGLPMAEVEASLEVLVLMGELRQGVS